MVMLQGFGKGDGVPLGKRVSGRNDDNKIVLTIRQQFEVPRGNLPSEDTDINLSFRDSSNDLRAGVFPQVDADVRMRQQVLAQHRRQELSDRSGTGKDAKMSLDALRVLLQVTVQTLRFGKDRSRVLNEGSAGGSQRDALARTIEKLQPAAALEALHAPACCRNREMRGLGASSQAVELGDTHHQSQVDQIEMKRHSVHLCGVCNPSRSCRLRRTHR